MDTASPPKNVYHEICSTASNKVIDLIKQLDADRQIDHDNYGDPYICKLEQIEGARSRKRLIFLRNRTLVHIVINTRLSDIIVSKDFDVGDGWVRPETQKVRFGEPENPRAERQRRVTTNESTDKYIRAVKELLRR